MKIGFVTQWFPPEKATTPLNMARALQDRGAEMHVLTGWPNYPTGKLAPGYPRRPYSREEIDGINVHRAALIPSHSQSAVGRVANYSSFALSAMVSTTLMPRMDAWLVYHSPATASLPALVASRRWSARGLGLPLAQVIQDLWPDSFVQSGMVSSNRVVGAAQAAIAAYCRMGYRASHAIGVISPGARDKLIGRGVHPEKIYYTPNWTSLPPPPEDPHKFSRTTLGLPDGRLVLYAGNLGHLQHLERFARLIAQVPSLKFVMMGDGVAESSLASLAEAHENIHVLDSVPFRSISPYLLSADALLVSLRDTPLTRITMPSKMQSSLAAGRPVIVHGAGDMEALVRRANAGLVVDPTDDLKALEALRVLGNASADQLAQWSGAAKATYLANFTEEAGGDALQHLMEAAIARHAAKGSPTAPLADCEQDEDGEEI